MGVTKEDSKMESMPYSFALALLCVLSEELMHKKKKKSLRRPRALREGPLSGKLEASPEGPLNLH
eukprot:667610-Pelagomonas_calceolata.AAC.1